MVWDLSFIIGSLLWPALIVVAVAVIIKTNLVSSAICLSIYSLIVAALFLCMHAPDVAITEAAIGAAISLLFYLATFRITGDEEEGRNYVWPAAVTCLLLCGGLISAVNYLPEAGDAASPTNKNLGAYYLENSVPELGVKNAVTAVLASYRGYDTLGETYVILCAAFAVMLVLPKREKL